MGISKSHFCGVSLLKIIHKEWRILWNIKEDIEEIQRMIVGMTIRGTDSYRKANELVDTMANLALDGDGALLYQFFQDLPSLCKNP